MGVAAVKEPKKGGDLGALAAKAGEDLGRLVETGAAVVGALYTLRIQLAHSA